MVKRNDQIRDLRKHKLLQDHIMLVAVEFEVESGKVFKPTQYEDKPEWGLVLGVGQGITLDSGAKVKPDISDGDVVLFSKYGSQKCGSAREF